MLEKSLKFQVEFCQEYLVSKLQREFVYTGFGNRKHSSFAPFRLFAPTERILRDKLEVVFTSGTLIFQNATSKMSSSSAKGVQGPTRFHLIIHVPSL